MSNSPRISITHTALIWVGIGLCIFGAIVAVIGLGGTTTFKVELWKIKAETSQTGLAISIIGALLAGIVAIKLPRHVQTLAKKSKYSFSEKIMKRIPLMSLIIVVLFSLLLLISFIYWR